MPQLRLEMEYVYVVTVSARGADKGEFHGTPTAFGELIAAQLSARVCREAIGGRFWAVDASDEAHVLQRWDSDEHTVWVERLVFEGAR